MRTTVDLPVDLFRRAKARSAARGESLKALVIRAVAAEVGPEPVAARGRMTLPLFGDSRGRPVDLRSSHLAQALANEDAVHARRGRRR